MKEKTTGVKRCKYDASFKEEVLKMVHHGRPASEVAQRLGIGENLIYKWKSRSNKEQQPATVFKGANTGSPEEQHALLLFRELEQERDILKKALGIFSRQT